MKYSDTNINTNRWSTTISWNDNDGEVLRFPTDSLLLQICSLTNFFIAFGLHWLIICAVPCNNIKELARPPPLPLMAIFEHYLYLHVFNLKFSQDYENNVFLKIDKKFKECLELRKKTVVKKKTFINLKKKLSWASKV